MASSSSTPKLREKAAFWLGAERGHDGFLALQKLVKSGLLRGVEIEVTLNSDKFAGDGDLALFGEMLNRFLALYATVNVYTKLVVVSMPTGRRETWPDNKAAGAPF